MKKIFCILLFLTSFQSIAQMADCYVEKRFLIINSTKNYKFALQVAQRASKDLNLELDLRDLGPSTDTTIGLSMPKDSCIKYWESNTCYLARGRGDDGDYVSIEYSNAYSGFARGYYIVVVASGLKKDPKMAASLKRVKAIYKDAYSKVSKVYMCCMH